MMLRIFLILAVWFASMSAKLFGAEIRYEDDPNRAFVEMQMEIESLRMIYWEKENIFRYRVSEINHLLKESLNLEAKVDLLVEKDELRDAIIKLKEEEYSEISKIRYLKGLQVLKILYEKILSLDHHFASIYTFSEINKISNPNTYPEFQQVKDLIRNKKNRKFNLDLSNILMANPIAATANTFINLLDFDLTSGSKKQELQNLECILDFTLSMQNELNTIYFETTFLQSGNESLKEEIEQLFIDYTKPIGYEQSLKECRSKDDWDRVRANLESYLRDMAETKGREQFKKHVNIEFPIDRLLRFIESYNNFIDQGEQFYRKFKIILNSYENAEQCKSQLPAEYTKLKNDIDLAIDKFNVAYKPVEVNGSKMKEIIYGLNEFE